MNRPYIICHMLTSIDGKVTGQFLKNLNNETGTNVYYELNRNYHANAFACGRITMEESFTKGFYPDLSVYQGIKILHSDFISPVDKHYFAVSFDRRGLLGWQTSHIKDDDPGYNNAHIIEVVLDDVKDEYLAYLQSIGVSYIFGGKDEMDINLVLEKLYTLFNIKTLMLEGGSVLDGAFQIENVIDELSLVVVPKIADETDLPLFKKTKVADYTLKKLKKYEDGVIWLNYKK